MQKGEDLPERWEVVTGCGFSSPTDARSTRRQTVHLHGNHEEADTRLILHSCEAASEGYERLVLRRSDTDVLLLLFYYMPTRVAEVWMVSGTSTQQKCYPVHTLSNQFSQPVRENLLSFHTLTGCDSLIIQWIMPRRNAGKSFRDNRIQSVQLDAMVSWI